MKTTTTAQDVYNMVRKYLTDNDIPVSYIVSTTAADGAPIVMERHKEVLKLLKDNNPDMMTVHCINHRESLAAARHSLTLDELVKKVIEVVNLMKVYPETERLFQVLCKDMNKKLCETAPPHPCTMAIKRQLSGKVHCPV